MADIPVSNYSNKFYDGDTVLKLMYEFGTQTILNLNSLNSNFDPNKVAHELLDAIPSADVVEVRHGEWDKDPDGYTIWKICSNCHDFYIPTGWANDYHFCPNCGADMRGKGDG